MNIKTRIAVGFSAATIAALGFVTGQALSSSPQQTPASVDCNDPAVWGTEQGVKACAVTDMVKYADDTQDLLLYVPECEYEDGSTQTVCLHDDDSGDPVINMDHGHYTYNLRTNTLERY